MDLKPFMRQALYAASQRILTRLCHLPVSVTKSVLFKKIIKDSFNYYGMTVWNEIPIEIRNPPNIKSFNFFTRSIC